MFIPFPHYRGLYLARILWNKVRPKTMRNEAFPGLWWAGKGVT